MKKVFNLRTDEEVLRALHAEARRHGLKGNAFLDRLVRHALGMPDKATAAVRAVLAERDAA